MTKITQEERKERGAEFVYNLLRDKFANPTDYLWFRHGHLLVADPENYKLMGYVIDNGVVSFTLEYIKSPEFLFFTAGTLESESTKSKES